MKRPLVPVNTAVSEKNRKTGDCTADEDSVKQIVVKGKAPVDSVCTEKIGVAHIYCEGDDIYDVLLNQTNVQYNNNKYYIIQLLEDDVSRQYSVWLRWGRVGKPGQNKLETFGANLTAAKYAFKKKFSDKTLNDWDLRGTFEKMKGKYDLVHVDYTVKISEDESIKRKPEPKPSTLPEAVQLLLNLIGDLKSMEATVKELQYDARRAPLGKLTKQQVKAGYLALTKVTDCIKQLEELDNPQSGALDEVGSVCSDENKETKIRRRSSKPSAQSDRNRLNALLLEACNDFYTRIPHDFGMRVPPILRTTEDIRQKQDLLEALDEIEYAVRILHQEDEVATENLLDVQYRQLQCDLSPLNHSDHVYQILSDYLEMTHGESHNWYTLEVLDIFECQRHGESGHFKDCGNRMLLWHGSRLSNWVGILGHGLKVAPPEAPVTGYMFGKGIYFADCVSKSANYAYPTQRNDVGLIALCEVSLGQCNELYQACSTAANLPQGHCSVKGVGQVEPDPATWKKLPDGVIVPSGKLRAPVGRDVTKCSLLFNEYVVYDVQQIRLRYIMKVKFHFC